MHTLIFHLPVVKTFPFHITHPNLPPPNSENLPTSHTSRAQHFLSPHCSFIALSRKQRAIPLTNQFCVCLKPTGPENLLYLPQSLSPSVFPNENHNGHCLPDDPAWKVLEHITYFVNLKIKGPLYLRLHSPLGSACPSPIHQELIPYFNSCHWWKAFIIIPHTNSGVRPHKSSALEFLLSCGIFHIFSVILGLPDVLLFYFNLNSSQGNADPFEVTACLGFGNCWGSCAGVAAAQFSPKPRGARLHHRKQNLSLKISADFSNKQRL